MTFNSALAARFRRWNPALQLTSSWLFGIILGFVFVQNSKAQLLWMVRLAPAKEQSLVFLLLGPTLLLGSIELVLRYFKRHYILGVILIKAFSFSVCGFATAAVFCSASWLVICLMLLSDFWICTVFLWYCFRVLSCTKGKRYKEMLVYFGAVIPLTLLDYVVISPFLKMLFT